MQSLALFLLFLVQSPVSYFSFFNRLQLLNWSRLKVKSKMQLSLCQFRWAKQELLLMKCKEERGNQYLLTLMSKKMLLIRVLAAQDTKLTWAIMILKQDVILIHQANSLIHRRILLNKIKRCWTKWTNWWWRKWWKTSNPALIKVTKEVAIVDQGNTTTITNLNPDLHTENILLMKGKTNIWRVLPKLKKMMLFSLKIYRDKLVNN